jgi:hypothetical protein
MFIKIKYNNVMMLKKLYNLYNWNKKINSIYFNNIFITYYYMIIGRHKLKSTLLYINNKYIYIKIIYYYTH